MAPDPFVEWLLVWGSPVVHIGFMVFIFVLCIGVAIGFAMSWGVLSQKSGCALLLAVLILIIVAFALEPVITGERQRSTAAVSLIFSALGFGLAAAIGAATGTLARWFRSRKR